jgi:hypothetical protein
MDAADQKVEAVEDAEDGVVLVSTFYIIFSELISRTFRTRK